MKPKRKTQTDFQYHAECRNCGREWKGKNAQAVAAVHCDRYGHDVEVHVTGEVLYDHAGK